MYKPKNRSLIFISRAPYIRRSKRLYWSLLLMALVSLCCFVVLQKKIIFQDGRHARVPENYVEPTEIEHPIKHALPPKIVEAPRLVTNEETRQFEKHFWMDNSQTYTFDYPELIQPRGLPKDLRFLVLVVSAPGYVENRQAVRETWMQDLQTSQGTNSRVVFVLGRSDDRLLENSVKKEAEQFGDIVQFDFQDSYRNLTTKVVTMVGWATRYRPTLLAKTDDDTMINVAMLLPMLDRLQSSLPRDFIAGYYLPAGLSQVRLKFLKWYVSYEEYPEATLPAFVGGLFYLMPGNVAARLYDVALHTRLFPGEDVYFTGCVAVKAGIPREHLPEITVFHYINSCNIHSTLAAHHSSPQRMRKLFQILKTTTRQCNFLYCSCIANS